jgi:23S rRNA (cytidine1920-2'-O)/16S rRNA (cytidine1409-2'-O)-methyltransferase
MRLDIYLATHHGVTRNRAQQLIATDLVLVNNRVCNKASFQVLDDTIVEIIADRRVEWVSRSAEKLAGFIEWLDIPMIISGSNCLDVGSSTGGFTQVLLQYGASHVDAVDVGTDQLHLLLRSDPRVRSYEQTDIREFAKSKHDPYDIIVCDASFISLALIFDAMIALASGNTLLIVLYKPQFEVGRANLRKTGVPKDMKIVESKMKEFEQLLTHRNMNTLKKEKSSLIGEAGNQEWIYMLQKNSQV